MTAIKTALINIFFITLMQTGDENNTDNKKILHSSEIQCIHKIKMKIVDVISFHEDDSFGGGILHWMK